MLISLDLTFFRRHERLHVDFSDGLNALRGPNESGKTTITEALLYAWYGADALRDPLVDVVTWGRKDNELRVSSVMQVNGTRYTATRSKSGAEINWIDAEGVQRKVAGQKETKAFTTDLLGADWKTANMLMLASQAGLRGALEAGTTGISTLIGKLADFDAIDKILAAAERHWMLGSDEPLRAKLETALADAAQAQNELIGADQLPGLDKVIETAREGLARSEANVIENLQPALDAARAADDEAKEKLASHERAQQNLTAVLQKLQTERARLVDAERRAADAPDPAALQALRHKLANATESARLSALYREFNALPAYPAAYWDEPVGKLEVAERDNTAALTKAQTERSEAAAELRVLQGRFLRTGNCPTCNQPINDDEHARRHNAETEAAVASLQARIASLDSQIADLQGTRQDFEQLRAAAKPFLNAVVRFGTLVEPDDSVFPPRLAWKADVPPAEQLDPKALQAEISALEARQNACAQATGAAAAHRAAVEELEAAVKACQDVLDVCPWVDLKPTAAMYEEAYQAYLKGAEHVRHVRSELDNIVAQRNEYAARVQQAQQRHEMAVSQAKVIEQDIRQMAFHNALVKKVKGFKPLVTDHLWNTVLAAVSTYFSQMRGEASVVTKNADGFQINDKPVTSYSGSTLDVLALGMRAALSKTFLPNTSFMCLDEPAHGCDPVRTGNVLAFLAGIGFDQVILASHDELSESVANNVIQLGEPA
jgi:exonuclease SbcC